MFDEFKIYYISLDGDCGRRVGLNNFFPKYFGNMERISAVYGKNIWAYEYFESIQEYYKRHNRLITPGELGASLSHIKALNEFIESGDLYALILEDDIQGSDEDLDRICEFIPYLKETDILLCGGQTSNGIVKYQLGKNTEIDGILSLSHFSYSYVYGACCYLISRKAALHILSSQNGYLKLADNWDLFFKNTNFRMLYNNILNHPDDRSNSHLQKERNIIFHQKKLNFMQRVISGRFFSKNYHMIKNHLKILFLYIKGYRRLR